MELFFKIISRGFLAIVFGIIILLYYLDDSKVYTGNILRIFPDDSLMIVERKVFAYRLDNEIIVIVKLDGKDTLVKARVNESEISGRRFPISVKVLIYPDSKLAYISEVN